MSTFYPYRNTIAGHDLIADGDLVETIQAGDLHKLAIAAHSDDNAAFDVSVKWLDANGNVTQQETASELSMSSITDDWCLLVPKGPRAEVTLTDTSGGGANVVNVRYQGVRMPD